MLLLSNRAQKINLASPAIRQNPYPTYAKLRNDNPVALVQLPFFGRVYFLSRYQDVLDALKDTNISTEITGKKRGERDFMPKSFEVLARNMLTQDDPQHDRLRRLVHRAFTPRRIQSMSDRIVAITDELLDKADKKERVDLVADFALPIPLTIISDMLAVPQKERAEFNRLVGGFLESTSSGIMHTILSYGKLKRIIRLLEGLIADRRKNPGDDLVSALIEAEEKGDRLDQDEVVGMIFLLLLAGHETTVNLIASGALALLEFQDELELLRADPGLWENALEELLRFTNPVELSTPRRAIPDLKIHGVEIPAGHKMLLGIGSANRDETVFENPERLDITRSPNKHLAFGMGIHYCLGAPLARMEGKIALKSLIERFPDLTLAKRPEELAWRSSTLVRGLKSLPVYMHGAK